MALTNSPSSAPSRRFLIISLGVLLSLGVVIAMFLAGSSRRFQHSYVPLLLGMCSVAGLLTLLNRFVFPRSVWSGGIFAVLLMALLEAIPFLYVFMFLLLNSFGE